MVFWQVAGAERLFKVPSWWRKTVEAVSELIGPSIAWVASRLGRRGKTVQGSASIHAGVTVIGTLTTRVARTRAGSVAEQVASLWQATEDIYAEIDRLQAEATKNNAANRQQVQALSDDLAEKFEQLSRLLRESSLGSRRFQVIGALLIVAGIILLGVATWRG
jgi:hypothetical protein